MISTWECRMRMSYENVVWECCPKMVYEKVLRECWHTQTLRWFTNVQVQNNANISDIFNFDNCLTHLVLEMLTHLKNILLWITNNVILSRQEFLCVPETLHFLHSVHGCASYQSGSWSGMAWRLMHIIKWMINFCWNLNFWPENRTYQVWCQQLQTLLLTLKDLKNTFLPSNYILKHRYLFDSFPLNLLF